MPRSRLKSRTALAAVALGGGCVTVALAAPPMLPGAWRQTVVYELMDNETKALTKLSESTTTACFTAQALAQPPLSSEKMDRAGGKCEPIEREAKQDGASEVWRISCRAANGKKYRMVSEVTYTASSMRNVLHSFSAYEGEVIQGRVTTQTERVGECTPDMPNF